MAQQPPGWGQQPQHQSQSSPAPQQPNQQAGWGSPPPQQGWGQPPQAPPPRRRRSLGKAVLIVVGVIVGLGILGSLLPDTGTPTDQKSPTASVPATTAPSQQAADTTVVTPPAAKAAKVGSPVRDGRFEFTVKRIHCGVPRIGSTYLSTRAQGQFCLMTMHVQNIGDEAQILDASNQYLFDQSGRRFETSDASLYLEDSKTFLEEINPGNAVDGTLVYDVPKSFKAAKVELHDSAFSGGVTVQL